jgi:4'-phosphopantetheinyl transferase
VLLGYGPQGKPRLAGQNESARLCFNVTHSHSLALYAIVRERPVGVDIERVRADLEFEEMADRFFSPAEVAELRALPAEEQVDAFFRCWTRKEAYLKARGDGLTVSTHQFSVPLRSCLPFAPLRTGDTRSAEGEWYIRALDPGVGYAAAMVVQGAAQRLQCWQWAYHDETGGNSLSIEGEGSTDLNSLLGS